MRGEKRMLISYLLNRQRENENIAIKYGNNMLTYTEWHCQSSALSKYIMNISEDNNKCIGVFLPNSIDYAVAYFGVMYSSKILVPIGIQAKKLEIISTIEYCEIDVIITNSQYKEFLINALNGYKHKIKTYIIDNGETININGENSLIPKTNYLNQDGSNNDVAIMLHTSGTTSNPKRVMLTHRNLISNIESNITSLQLAKKDKALIALPMFFGYCNTAQFLTHLYLGASIVIFVNVFLPKQFFQLVEKEKITNFTGVPSMLLMLLDYRYSDKYDYSSLRYICFGGGNMPVVKLKELINKYSSISFVQTYGQTECSPRITALMPQYALCKVGSVGTPIPNVNIRIVDANDNELPYNQIGEIVVQGENMMKGYYKQPNITNETIKNGWLHTGDLGYLDNEGFLYLTGRIKNIIISGGINIYPEEIETLLLQHDCIENAYVIGEEHNLLGEVPIAKIVLKAQITLIELKAYCTEKLADYKVPVRFDFVEDLPKTYNGKIKRY